MSPPLSPRPESPTIHHVLETHTISSHRSLATGNRTINNYEILGDIGAGVHGKVKRARDLDTGETVAIKIINRVTKKRLGNYDPNEQENKIKREIAIMKKCQHPNIVNLIEVIDNPNSQKVYLGTFPFWTMDSDKVLEYVERGEIKWRDRRNRPILTVDEIRLMMRDVVLGLEYIHFQGIIHRDIKPGNLLITLDGTVKISDFGVSHLAKMDEAGNLLPENDLDLAKTAGSPAFFAPELCQFETRPVITKAIDVWALGVTFYCLLFGREPFPNVQGEMELYHKIRTEEIEPPADQADRIDVDTKDLLKRLLIKDPQQRITLSQVRRHSFITKDIPNPKIWIESTDLTKTATPLEVTPQEVASAVTSFRNIFRRTLAQVKMTARRSMSYLRPRQSSGRSPPDITSPVLPTTTPSSPAPNSRGATRSAPNLSGVEAPSPSRSPVSDVTDIRPKASHAYFESIGRSNDVTPPTPPHSTKFNPVLPNGHVNGTTIEMNHSPTNSSIKSPLTPPPPSNPAPMNRLLNDDYSNIYYSGSDFDDDDGFDKSESEDEDDGDRLEIRFGAKKK